MSRTNIAVDPSKRSDMYYRYTMPPVITKIEGSGNGIKTVFPNILEVCAAINRPSEVVMKFFQFECGAQRTVSRDQKCWLMGQFQENRIQKVMDDFIIKYVLCEKCHSPETTFLLENRALVSHCDACGHSHHMNSTHKVHNSMLNHYISNERNQPTSAVKTAAKKTTAAAEATSPDTAAPVEATAQQQELKAAPPAAAQPQPQQQAAVTDDVESPVVLTLRHFRELQKKFPDNMEQQKEGLVRHLRTFLNRYCRDDYIGVVVVFYMFDEAFPGRFCEAIQKYHNLIKEFTNATEMAVQSAFGDESKMADIRKSEAKQRVSVLKETAKLFYTLSQEPSKKAYYTIDQLIKVVFVLYAEGIVDSSNIEKWMAKPFILDETPASYTEELHQKIAPFAEWLNIEIKKKG